MEKTFVERRRPFLCPNCGTQMVCMNKYMTEGDREFYVWYVCPRRKASDEKGCGHQSPLEVKKIEASKEAEAIFGDRVTGEVRSWDKGTMIIENNFETFETWLHYHREKFEGKRVEILVRIIK